MEEFLNESRYTNIIIEVKKLRKSGPQFSRPLIEIVSDFSVHIKNHFFLLSMGIYSIKLFCSFVI